MRAHIDSDYQNESRSFPYDVGLSAAEKAANVRNHLAPDWPLTVDRLHSEHLPALSSLQEHSKE